VPVTVVSVPVAVVPEVVVAVVGPWVVERGDGVAGVAGMARVAGVLVDGSAGTAGVARVAGVAAFGLRSAGSFGAAKAVVPTASSDAAITV
jgi:hypothetical protein